MSIYKYLLFYKKLKILKFSKLAYLYIFIFKTLSIMADTENKDAPEEAGNQEDMQEN